jgi:hypothetical protein
MDGSKRNMWLIVVAVVLFAFAGYRVFFGASSKLDLPDTFTGYGVCLACREEAIVIYKRGVRGPFRCEACGEQAVYLWWFCNDCGYRFIPELIRKPGEPPRPTPYPYCTHCSCNSISGWDPEDPSQFPEGDARLPQWP